MTAIFAAIFMLNSLFLTYLFQSNAPAAPESLLDQVQDGAATTAPAAPPVDADAVPQVAPQQQPAQQPEQAPENPQN
jgi:hypothetical protein